MIPLFIKEINVFFSSLTGYIVIIIFLLLNSLFIWVFPGDFNILDSGYSGIESLFVIAPWVFMFLVPAITMRLFAEEKRSGTIELLFTKPLSELEIIFAKYFAGLSLVLLSLLPTLVYFLTVYLLGKPIGNIDTGGTWGAYIGLFFLAAIYTSIGIFASSITENQIIAFLLAMLFSFMFYLGFDSIASIIPGNLAAWITSFGIDIHYKSLSRGVIDLRDVVYYISVVAIFILLTKTVLESRKW